MTAAADDALDLEPALEALNRLVEEARPVRFLDQVWLDREAVYDVLDTLRIAVPFSIPDLRWYRNRRAQDGDPPLGDAPIDAPGFFDPVLASIDALDDLVHRAPGSPFSDKVRVSRERFAELAGGLRSTLEPAARELAYAKGIYGSELEAARAAADTEAAAEAGGGFDLPLPELRTSTLGRVWSVYSAVMMTVATTALAVVGVLSIRDGTARSIVVGVLSIAASIYFGVRTLSLRRSLRRIRSLEQGNPDPGRIRLRRSRTRRS